MTRSRWSRCALAAVFVGMVVTALGCGSHVSAATRTHTRTQESPDATAQHTSSPSPSGDITTTIPEATATLPTMSAPPTTAVHFVSGAPCRRGQIEVNQADPVPADQHTLAPFVVTNTSATPCTLTGYVTVRVVDQIGREIGKSETHEPGPVTSVTLHPNGADQANFELHTKVHRDSTHCAFSSFIGVALPGADLNPPAYSGAIGVSVCDGYLGVTPVIAGSKGHA